MSLASVSAQHQHVIHPWVMNWWYRLVQSIATAACNLDFRCWRTKSTIKTMIDRKIVNCKRWESHWSLLLRPWLRYCIAPCMGTANSKICSAAACRFVAFELEKKKELLNIKDQKIPSTDLVGGTVTRMWSLYNKRIYTKVWWHYAETSWQSKFSRQSCGGTFSQGVPQYVISRRSL